MNSRASKAPLTTTAAGGSTQVVRTASPGHFPLVIAETLSAVVQRLLDDLNPDKIVIFGSHARQAAGPHSDVDLLVVMSSDGSPAERAVRVCRSIRPRPFPVDIGVRTPAEMHDAVSKGDPFVKEILDTGEVLYDRAHGSSGLG